MLSSIFASEYTAASISLTQLLSATGASLALGLLAALIYMYRNTYSKGYVLTLAVMPAIVQIVIMLVNGNLGAGVAVAGAFSLVRFRSAPGGAREIAGIFLAMAIGLATGMGYILTAAIFLVLIGVFSIVLCSTRFGEQRGSLRQLKITIPEDMDYAGLFDDLFEKYTAKHEFMRVRTTNLGSLFELTYTIVLKDIKQEKAFIDEVRCRNGNLNITCGHMPSGKEEL